jgi:hypothetical protein
MHVQNFTFWKQSGIATGVPAAWMASHVTFVETGRAENARDFKSAGGRYTIIYADPNYYFVSANEHSPGNYPESAYGHDANGNHVTRSQGNGVEHYLLPNSPATRDAYSRVTAYLADGPGVYDYVFADGVSDKLQTSLYRMSAQPVEIQSDSDYVQGMKSVLAVAARPVIANGFDNGDPLTEAQNYAGAPNIAGIYGESCMMADNGPKVGNAWMREADALLYTTDRRLLAFCGGHGRDPNNEAGRLYWLASWWLTYDPNYSVAVEVFKAQGGAYVFPETGLVPVGPLQTAGSDINALRTSGGTYAREFQECYADGSSVGACAAVVNPTNASAAMPTLSRHYSRALTLDNRDLFDGGRTGLSGTPPSALASGQGVVLLQ